jgi:ATP-dependent exoDNAse (exonuclease V) alpha subunit
LPEVVGLKERAASRYTTRTVLMAEEGLLANAAALAGRGRHEVPAAWVRAAFDRHPALNAEQRAALRHATAAGGLALIAGEAGTGKTATLAAIRNAYEGAGYRAIGMAWTNAVVEDLRRGGFGEATTIASALYRLNAGPLYRHRYGGERWDNRTVLIVE